MIQVPDRLPSKEPDEHCNARTRSGGYCKNRAGYGTDHVGVGRCKFHGGSTPVKHALYSRYRDALLGRGLGEVFDQLVNDPELKDLRQEAALLRALVIGRLKREDGSGDEAIPEIVERLSRVVKRLHEIEEGRHVYVHVSGLQVVIQQVVQVIERHVPDPDTRAAIAADLRGIRLPTG